MKYKLYQILSERNIPTKNFSTDELYNAGMVYVKNNIEFYFDKTFTCESVIKELFIRGVIDLVEKK